MKISIADLKKGPREFDIYADPAEFHLEAERFEFPAPVTGRVRFKMVGRRVVARGFLETRIRTVCVRCLGPVEQAVRADVALVFEKRPPVGDDPEAALAADWEAEVRGTDYYDEDMLDPGDAFRQLVLLELPNYPLCSENCKGLCPFCGADLNKGECRCRKTAVAAVGESDWKARLKKIRLT